MKNKTCVITGANGGIGKETAVALAAEGAHIVMLCRSRQRAETARQEIVDRSGNTDVDVVQCDLGSLASVKQAANSICENYPRIDVLINNAGCMNMERSTSEDGYESTFATNYLSHFLLTQLLLERLRESAPARIINVSSMGHKMAKLDFTDLMLEKQYKGFQAYNNSKLANILFTYQLADALHDSGVTVNTLHPGMVNTSFADGIKFSWFTHIITTLLRPWVKSPAQGAETTIHLASATELGKTTGTYWVDSKQRKSSGASYDRGLQEKLWEHSVALLRGYL